MHLHGKLEEEKTAEEPPLLPPAAEIFLSFLAELDLFFILDQLIFFQKIFYLNSNILQVSNVSSVTLKRVVWLM